MKKLIILFILFLSCSGIFAQNKRLISGQVLLRDYCKGYTDYAIGVTVSLKNSATNITITDIDGNYRIEASEEDYLVFSYLGCKSHTERVGARFVIDVTLEEDYQDLGLPSIYYIRSNVFGSARTTFMNDFHGYSYSLLCTLPFTSSDRCGTSLYDQLKSRLAIGVNVAKIKPGKGNVTGSLYLEMDFRKWLSLNINNTYSNTICRILPYAVSGLYVDAENREIQSQNFEYGAGFKISLGRRHFMDLYIGYRGYVKQSSYNNFNIEAYPKVKWIPHWIEPNVGYQAFVKQSEYNNFFIGVRILALKWPLLYY